MKNLLERKNLLWESSRMFLPEHRNSLSKQHKQAEKITPPTLDEHKLEEINRSIYQAMYNDRPLIVNYVTAEERMANFCGHIHKINPFERCLVIHDNGEQRTIPFNAICWVEEMEDSK